MPQEKFLNIKCAKKPQNDLDLNTKVPSTPAESRNKHKKSPRTEFGVIFYILTTKLAIIKANMINGDITQPAF